MGVINENQIKVNTTMGHWIYNSNEKENKKNDFISENLDISPKSQFSLSTTIDDKKAKELQQNLLFLFQKNNIITFNLNKVKNNYFDKNKKIFSTNEKNYKSNDPILKPYPSNAPNLYNNMYSLSEDNIIYFSNRNYYRKINKFKIPNAFYNHLMIKKSEKKSGRNNCYISTSITKRTKGKLLTYIYYYPQRKYSK